MPGTRKTNLLLLGMGAVLLVLVQARCAVAPLAWVAPVPFLLYLRTTSGRGSRLLFVGVMFVSWTSASAKFVGAPLPPVLMLFNGAVFGLLYSVAYFTWSVLARFRLMWVNNLGFAGIMVVFEWLTHRVFGLGGNTAIGYSQLDNLPYLQTASVLGLAGLSFFIYWFAAVAAAAVYARKIHLSEAAVVVSLIATAHIIGAFRIGIPQKTPTTKVAAVVTNWNWWPGDPLPSEVEQINILEALFARSVRAAEAEAKIVVWPEVATWVAPKDEAGVIARGKAMAATYGIHLVLAYIVPKRPEPLLVENKYLWVEPNGATHVYLKHKPLPMEPSIPGDGTPIIVETEYGNVSGAICWDADFPHVARQHAVAGSALLVLPSADTPGVDPWHTQIAGVRAVEGGYSVLRPTRNGLSAGIGPRGRIRGLISANESNEEILVVSLPIRPVPTIYRLIGDALVWISMIGIGVLLVTAIVGRKKRAQGKEIKSEGAPA